MGGGVCLFTMYSPLGLCVNIVLGKLILNVEAIRQRLFSLSHPSGFMAYYV